MVRALALALIGCGGGAVLELDGPSEVRVERMGPVEGPGLVLSSGARPEGVIWSVEPASVARIEGDRVIAEAEGEARVTGAWQGQSVGWTLKVVPTYELVFVDAPAAIAVGGTCTFHVAARRGGEATPPTEVVFSTSDASILAVDEAGKCEGVAAGVAYVTVAGHGSTAMAEVRVE